MTKLYQAGGVLIGKLATHEFAHGGPSFDLPWPPARNPWNREHFTGGSSSGSGAAVAAGFVPAALGSDTGGSIRGPAALCGIVGLKPTYGLVSRAGVYANSFSFDHAGPMTWTVEDCAIMLQAIAGHDPKDPASATRPVPDYRAALDRRHQGLADRHRPASVRGRLHGRRPRCGAALEEAFAVFRSLGARLEEVRHPAGAGLLRRQDHDRRKRAIRDPRARSCAPGPAISATISSAASLPAVLYSGPDYVQAQRERRRMLAEMAPVYAQLRCAGDADRRRPGAAARHLAHDRVLAASRR